MFLDVVLWVVPYWKEIVINILGALYWCISPSLILPNATLRVCVMWQKEEEKTSIEDEPGMELFTWIFDEN